MISQTPNAVRTGVNQVYQSSNLEMSRFINKNGTAERSHSQVPVRAAKPHNQAQNPGYKAIIENKGSRCRCNQQTPIQ